MEEDAARAEAEVEAMKQREMLMRREWAGKTKAAEWALKAYRDKQAREPKLHRLMGWPRLRFVAGVVMASR